MRRKEIQAVEAAFQDAPENADKRRAYAVMLFKLGNMWQARDVIVPPAKVSSSNTEDLHPGARLALLHSEYDRAEALFQRLVEVSEKGSETHGKAIRGLVMVYYQTNHYEKARGMGLGAEEGKQGKNTLLTFMRRFEGEPYHIE